MRRLRGVGNGRTEELLSLWGAELCVWVPPQPKRQRRARRGFFELSWPLPSPGASVARPPLSPRHFFFLCPSAAELSQPTLAQLAGDIVKKEGDQRRKVLLGGNLRSQSWTPTPGEGPGCLPSAEKRPPPSLLCLDISQGTCGNPVRAPARFCPRGHLSSEGEA